MFYRIGTSVVHEKRRLMKTSGKLCPFYSPRKGGLRNLAQSLFHDPSSYSLSRWTFSPPLMGVFIFIGIGFTGRSFWAFPVAVLSFIVGGDIRTWRGVISLCSTKLLFQIFYFTLQVLFINVLLHQMAPSSIALFPAWIVRELPSCWLSTWFSRSKLWSSSCRLTFTDSAWGGLACCGPEPAITVVNFY